MPSASVTVIEEENCPAPLFAYQLTCLPAMAALRSLTSASCALTTTVSPAGAVELKVVTMYLAGMTGAVASLHATAITRLVATLGRSGHLTPREQCVLTKASVWYGRRSVYLSPQPLSSYVWSAEGAALSPI